MGRIKVGGYMSRLRTFLAIVFASILAIGGTASAVLAQSGATGDSYSLASGSVVDWADPWVLDEQDSGYSASAAGDVVTLTGGDTARFVLSTYPGIVTSEDGRDGLLAQYDKTRDDVVEIDSGEDKTSAFSELTFTGDDGETWGSYSYWAISEDGQTLIGMELLSIVDDVETAFEAAQGGIAVDGVTVLADADGAEIADAMASGKSATKTTKNDKKKSTSTGTKTKTKTSKKPAIDPAFEEAGLIDASSYESPQFGYSVTWSDPWTVNPGDDEAVISDESSSTDSLYIATDDPSYALFSVAGILAEGTTPADAVDTWASQDFLDTYTGEGTEVLLDDSNRSGGAVVTIGTLKSDDSVEVVTVREVVSLDGGDTLVLMTLIVPTDSFEEVYDSVQDAVEIDGGPSVGFFTTDEIVAELP